MKKHISYSEMIAFNECPFRRHLIYEEGHKGFTNAFTAFGTAVHNTAEDLTENKIKNEEAPETFRKYFKEEVSKIETKLILEQKDLILDMRKQGETISTEILPRLLNEFGKFEVLESEMQLYEPIEGLGFEYYFKGFVDLIIKTKDERIVIIDYKTCSWGWDAKKKTDKMKIYQLVLYKHFVAQKLKVDPNIVDIYFFLLKRTASKKIVEPLKYTSGKKRTENALNLLTRTVKGIKLGNKFKNRTSCQYCQFKHTPLCPS